MATLDDLRQRLRTMQETFMVKLEELAEQAALAAKALAERNILEKGVGEPYSTKLVPVFFLEGKEINQGGTTFLMTKKKPAEERKKIRQANKVEKAAAKQAGRKPSLLDVPPRDDDAELVNWKGLREAEGLQTSVKDLHHSGRMFSSMGVAEVTREGKIIWAYLGSLDIEGQQKMNWNYAHYGDFIDKALGAEGQKIIGDFIEKGVNSIFSELNI